MADTAHFSIGLPVMVRVAGPAISMGFRNLIREYFRVAVPAVIRVSNEVMLPVAHQAVGFDFHGRQIQYLAVADVTTRILSCEMGGMARVMAIEAVAMFN